MTDYGKIIRESEFKKSLKNIEKDTTDYAKIIKASREAKEPHESLKGTVKKDNDSCLLIDKLKNILEERASTHGDFKDNFRTIARFWSEYLQLEGELSGKQVADMMILLKISRSMGGKDHEDDWLDKMGYANLGGQL